MRHVRILFALLSIGLLAPTTATAQTADTVEFTCGDTNFDGSVSLADVQFVLHMIFRPPPEIAFGWPLCWAAVNVNGDDDVDLSDVVYLAEFLLDGGSPPHDVPTDTRHECNEVPVAPPVDDPDARLVILETQPDPAAGTVTITIGLSSSHQLAGYRGVITGPFGAGDGIETEDLSETYINGFQSARMDGDRLVFGFLSSLREPSWIQPGPVAPVLELVACLERGTVAGGYDLELVEGELVEALEGRSIAPALEGTSVELAAALATNAGCDPADAIEPASETTCTAELPAPPEPDPENPPCGGDEVSAEFSLGSGTLRPGAAVDIPFTTLTSHDMAGFSFSIAFDPGALILEEITPVHDRPDRAPWDFERFNIDNETGRLSGAAVFSFRVAGQDAPANQENEMLSLRCSVAPTASPGPTMVAFDEHGTGALNRVTVCGAGVTPEHANSFVFVNAAVEILPEVTMFIRGDANGDELVDISDPRTTLDYLFLGRRRPFCFDAADSNDDGSVDLSDAIHTLNFLFLGSEQMPAPYPEAGRDETDDGMSCFVSG